MPKVRQSGSGRAGMDHIGLSDFKFSDIPRTGESPGSVPETNPEDL